MYLIYQTTPYLSRNITKSKLRIVMLSFHKNLKINISAIQIAEVITAVKIRCLIMYCLIALEYPMFELLKKFEIILSNLLILFLQT